MSRTAEVVRNTKETQIRIVLDLDGSGESKVSTGIGFFDHMLESFIRHGGFDEVFFLSLMLLPIVAVLGLIGGTLGTIARRRLRTA